MLILLGFAPRTRGLPGHGSLRHTYWGLGRRRRRFAAYEELFNLERPKDAMENKGITYRSGIQQARRRQS